VILLRSLSHNQTNGFDREGLFGCGAIKSVRIRHGIKGIPVQCTENLRRAPSAGRRADRTLVSMFLPPADVRKSTAEAPMRKTKNAPSRHDGRCAENCAVMPKTLRLFRQYYVLTLPASRDIMKILGPICKIKVNNKANFL
jgi:hypothetical protein